MPPPVRAARLVLGSGPKYRQHGVKDRIFNSLLKHTRITQAKYEFVANTRSCNRLLFATDYCLFNEEGERLGKEAVTE